MSENELEEQSVEDRLPLSVKIGMAFMFVSVALLSVCYLMLCVASS